MTNVAFALLVGLLAIAFAIWRLAQKVDTIRVESINIANAALWRYDQVHKIYRTDPPQKEVEHEHKSPRFRWTPAEQGEDPRGPKAK